MTPRDWAAFAATSVVWGVPHLFIKVAVDDGVSPALVAWARVVLAAVVLLALVGIDEAGVNPVVAVSLGVAVLGERPGERLRRRAAPSPAR